VRTRTRTMFCSHKQPLWLPPERILSKVRAAYFAINQPASTSLPLVLQKETWLFQEKLDTSVSLLRLCSLEKNVQHNGQDRSRDFWNWEESWTVWQNRHTLLIKRFFLRRNTELRSSLCLIIPTPWFKMTKLYLSSK